MIKPEKAINWLDSTRRSLQSAVPESAECAGYVTERLSALLLERMSPDVQAELIELLPEPYDHLMHFRSVADSTIGYPLFVEAARHALGLSDLLDNPRYADSEEVYANLCSRVANAYLWAIAQELPLDLKDRMAAHLPSDLKCRMNLFSGFSDAEKVA